MKLVGIDRGYEDLANEIILSGVKDYKRALIWLKRDPECKSAQRAVKEGERFLYSHWFEMLTNVDPSYIDRNLKKMVDEKYGG